METGYYSVQSILAESQTIQTKFLRKCPGIGYLDQENDDSEVRPGNAHTHAVRTFKGNCPRRVCRRLAAAASSVSDSASRVGVRCGGGWR